MNIENIKLLILGGGAVVTEYYLPALNVLNLIHNIEIIDASPNIVNNFQQLDSQIKVHQADFRDYLNKISSDYFDAVIIALPNKFHVEAIELCLEKGLDVLCEKPLAMNAEDCLKLDKLAKKKGKILSVGMVRRLLPSVSAIREGLNNNLIGKIKNVEIECGGPYGWLSDSGAFFQKENGGVLADMGVHYLDLVEDLVGLLTPVSYQDDSYGGVEANCEYKLLANNHIPVKLVLSRTHALKETAIFQGELGELSIKLNTFDGCFWKSYTSEQLNGKLYPEKPFKGGNWLPNFNSCFAEQFIEFIACIKENKQPRVSGKDAANTIGLIEWAYSQNQQQEKKISLPKQLQNITLSPAKTVVTGGTGFIGEHLIERLVGLGFDDLIVPVRGYKNCAGSARFSIKMPRINLLDYEQVKNCIEGSKYVFHLAYGNDGNNAAKITIEGTKNLVNAAIASGVESVVILSTMYVFGHPKTDKLVDESWPYDPAGGEYGFSKTKMERWCLEKAKNSPQTRIVILNPSCVYGPRGKTYTTLPISLTKAGNFAWIEEGKGTANYTYIDNLIDAILLASNSQKAHGERFLITDGFCTWREFLEPILGDLANDLSSYSYSDLVNKSGQTPTNVKDLIRHLVQDLELIDIINRMPVLGQFKQGSFKYIPKLYSLLRKEQSQSSTSVVRLTKTSDIVSYPPIWLAQLFGNTMTKFSAQKAEKILGWTPSISLKQGQENTVNWLKSIGYYR